MNIQPGRYKIEAEKGGFKKFAREPIVVQIESGIRIDIAMEVGAVSETIEVTAETPLLQSETNSLGQVIEQRTVTDLPLNGRNPLALSNWCPASCRRAAFGWKLLHWQPGRRQSFRAGRFSDGRRHGGSKPDSD